MSPEAMGWQRVGPCIFFVGATLCGFPLLGGHAGPPLRARLGSSPTGPRSRRRQDLRPMTFPLHFVTLASNATPRSSFSAGLYSVLYRLRDHPDLPSQPSV